MLRVGVCGLAGQEWRGFRWASLSLSLPPSACVPQPGGCSVSRSLGRLGLPPPRPLRCYGDGSERHGLSQHIPERLFGSSASVALRPGDERERAGKTSFSFFPLRSSTIESYYSPPMLCSFVPLMVSTHGSHVCSFDCEGRPWHLLTHKPLCLCLKQGDGKNILFASIVISKH